MSPLRILGRTVALLCLSCSISGSSAPPIWIPAPAEDAVAPAIERTGWVTDAADILPDEVEQRLTAKLAKFERRTLHQMVVVTVPTLAGRDVAGVANDLGNAWHIGRAGHDDGIVLLVAPNDRRVRISTADGIMELLPDEVCRRIIDETMVPYFREGDLAGGTEAGADAIIAHFG
ncbi:MAG TPA: TPM domain-containing protein [Croceibacterium sp.]